MIDDGDADRSLLSLPKYLKTKYDDVLERHAQSRQYDDVLEAEVWMIDDGDVDRSLLSLPKYLKTKERHGQSQLSQQ